MLSLDIPSHRMESMLTTFHSCATFRMTNSDQFRASVSAVAWQQSKKSSHCVHSAQNIHNKPKLCLERWRAAMMLFK